MKKLVIVLTVLFVFSASAYAQTGMMGGGMKGEQKGKMKQSGMMPEGIMQMCMPMMQQMMGQGMMMRDMMQMMIDMMNMQEKMMKGMKADEKKMMIKDIAQMKEKTQKMMSMRMGMMMGTGDPQAKLKCVEEWLKKAIDLHEIHINDPKTATEASQIEMMDQMKKAYECVSGTGSETSVTPTKKLSTGEKKKDEHGH